jgi:hypothetical protein
MENKRVMSIPPKVDKEEWPPQVRSSGPHWDVSLNLTDLACARQLLADVLAAKVKLWDGTLVTRKSDVLKWLFEQWDRTPSPPVNNQGVSEVKRKVKGKVTVKEKSL